MNKIFVTYSNELYAKSRDFAAKMAIKFGGFDRAVVYHPEDIDEKFRNQNSKILCQKRGAGLWLWKPYSIYKALIEECEFGNILFYGDAGSFFLRDSSSLLLSMKGEDIWLSNIPLVEKQYTKSLAFDLMNCNDNNIKDSAQIQANFICVRKSKSSVQFIKEWLDLCCCYDLISPDNDASNENEEFIAHRNDQSILSLLAKKYGIKPHLDPSQYGRYKMKYFIQGRIMADTNNSENYNPCIFLHREKEVSLKTILRAILITYLPQFVVKSISQNYHNLGNR